VCERLSIHRLSVLARDLAGQIDEASTIARTVEAAFDLVDCGVVDVVRFRCPRPLLVVASTDRLHSERTGVLSGPEQIDAALMCRPLQCPPRAPLVDSGHRDRAAGSGRSFDRMGGYVLRFHGHPSLEWSTADEQVATAVADLAAVAIDRAALRGQVESLAMGLQSNRSIGAAIGILMASCRTTYDEAFDVLRNFSQRTNRKLRHVAEDVILTGQLSNGDEYGAA